MEVPFLDISAQNGMIREDLDKAISKVMTSNQFIGGEAVERFELAMKNFLGAEYAVSCGNGTDALILALRACGIGPGDEVITTPFTFFATAEAICAVGAKPVFVDILPNSYLIDPDLIEPAITDKTKAILPVQIFGSCCDMDRIIEIARKHGLKVIEDDAQAIGSQYKNRMAGTLADVGCFSFYPTKNLGGCGDGGMCTTNDYNLFIRIKAMKEHGAGKNGSDAYESFGGDKQFKEIGASCKGLYNPVKYYNYLIGTNSRLDAIQAAILEIKLQHLNEYNKKRRLIACRYIANLTLSIELPSYDKNTNPCCHQFPILTNRKKELMEYLEKHGISTGNFYPVPLHKQKAFNKQNCGNYGVSLPVAEDVCDKIVCLPIYPELLEAQQDYVIDTINRFFKENDANDRAELFIHPSAEVSPYASVGYGTQVWNNAQIREGAKVGKNCIIGKNSYIDTNASLGNGVKVQNNVNVYNGVTVEDDAFLGPNMTFTNDMYPRAFNDDWKITPTLVKKGASIGAGAVIVCGVKIGRYSMVGAGSVVTKDVPDYTLVAGNPARDICKVCKCGKPARKKCDVCGFTVGEDHAVQL